MSAPTDLSRVPHNPEQLDRAVRTTTVRGWIALGLAALAVVAAVIWAFVATVERQVTATAVVTDPNAVRSVVAGAEGTVIVKVSPGDSVESGDEVAELSEFGGGTTTIDAPFEGRVHDVVVNQGEGVEPTDEILTVARTSSIENPKLTTFLPESEAVLYERGAEVTVELQNPATGKTTFTEAEVQYVADVPSQFEAMAVTLHSDALARKLADAAGNVAYRVVLKLEEGLADQVVEGQVAKVTNIYKSQHPIDLLFSSSE